MATKRRRGSARRTYASQEAARKRGAPGKRFVGETAEQSADARERERKHVGRMAGAVREAQPAEAARTAGSRRTERKDDASGPGPAGQPSPESGQSEAAFRAAQEDAALAGAEVEPPEPPEPPLATVSRLPARDVAERMRQLDAEIAGGPTEDPPWGEPPSADVSAEHGAERGAAVTPSLGWAVADLFRSALGLARAVAAAPLRFVLALPRLALRAVMRA